MVEQEQILSEEELDTIAEASQKLIDQEESDQVKKYEKYDFSQSAGAAQLLQDYLVVIDNLHQQCARLFADSVSGLIRSLTEVECTPAKKTTFGEFCDGLDDPSCFCKLSMEAVDGIVIMEVKPSLAFSVIEKFLGGTGIQEAPPSRPLTEIEEVIISQMVQYVIYGLDSIWKQAKDDVAFMINSDSFESEVSEVKKVLSPNDTVVVVQFSVKPMFAEAGGHLSICYPSDVVESIMAEAPASLLNVSITNAADSVDDKEEDNQYKPQVQERVSKAEVLVRAVFPKTIIPLSQLKELNLGRFIELDVRVENKRIVDPVILEVEGKPRFLGTLGQLRQKRAVRITGLVEDEDL